MAEEKSLEEKAERKRLKKEKKLKEAAIADVEPPVEKSEKKKKKKEKAAAMVVDIEPVVEVSEKKKKKRKRDVDEEEKLVEEVPVVESKKDKKKRKKESSTTTTATPAAKLCEPTSEEIAAYLTENSISISAPKATDSVIPILSFANLTADIPAELAKSFEGFEKPTPIQACTWPPALKGRDVVGIAETGSGKTLAFGIPALSRLITTPPPSIPAGAPALVHTHPMRSPPIATVTVLIVAPTRELAIQTHDTLSVLGKPFGIASVAVFGGVPKDAQVKMLRNAAGGSMVTRIIVGTPGRILDLVNDGICDLSRVNYLVLDEADRMLDSGFENDIRNIISHTLQGTERQTMMFSATWPEAVRRLASSFQQEPIRVTVGSDDLTANSRVAQTVEVFDDARSKDGRLLNHLKNLYNKKQDPANPQRILIFALYKKEASRVEQMLSRAGYAVGSLHGDLTQQARMAALDAFRNGTTGLLVATDVAARGLDIPDVGVVINYTFPLKIDDYIHRIGRTGRGGRTGKSITFFTGDDHERSLAGELARVMREGGFDAEPLKKFPMTIKKKTHGAYGAFYRDDIPVPKGPTKIVF